MPEQAEKKSESQAFEPVTFWIANPTSRRRIYRPDRYPVPITFRNGQFVATTPEDVALLRSYNDIYEEDYSERQLAKGQVQQCRDCGYRPKSLAAYEAHLSMHPVQPR